jgi:tetratricopeptide (TPR) repeat protein
VTQLIWPVIVLLLLPQVVPAGHNTNPPESASDYIQRGVICLAVEEYDRAIALFTEAVRLEPRNPGTYGNRGLAYSVMGKPDKAIADFNQALRLKPGDCSLYIFRGNACRDAGAYDKAIADYNEAIWRVPKSATAYYNRAGAYLKKREYGKAKADITEAIWLASLNGLDRQNLQIVRNSAWLLAASRIKQVRDGERAVLLAESACHASGWRDADSVGALAAAHAECGNFKEAVRREQQAIRLGYRGREARERGRERLKLYEAGKPHRE